jgi:hypothetical protein
LSLVTEALESPWVREFLDASSDGKKRKPARVAKIEIIDRLFAEPVEIAENGVPRKVSTLEAILLRLWAAEMSGRRRAPSRHDKAAASLVDRKQPGQPRRLHGTHPAALAAITESAQLSR